MLYSGYLTNIPIALEEAAQCGWSISTWKTYLEDYFPNHETNACDCCGTDSDLSTWNDVTDTTCDHCPVQEADNTLPYGTAELPDTVWNKL